MGELMEHTTLLDKAAATEDPYERCALGGTARPGQPSATGAGTTGWLLAAGAPWACRCLPLPAVALPAAAGGPPD